MRSEAGGGKAGRRVQQRSIDRVTSVGARREVIGRGIEVVGGISINRKIVALGLDAVVEVGPWVVVALVGSPGWPRVGGFANASMADAWSAGVGRGAGRVRDVDGARLIGMSGVGWGALDVGRPCKHTVYVDMD